MGMSWQFPDVTIIHCDRCCEDRVGELLVPSDVYGICSNKTDFDDGCHYVCWDCLTEDEESQMSTGLFLKDMEIIDHGQGC